MSADGEIEIAVTAEGAEDAAAEVADADPQAAGGDGGGGLSGGLGRAGGIGFIISKLLGPLLDVLTPIQQLLEAFLAPVAVLLLRLLQPAIRLLLKVLPVWLNFMDTLLGLVEFVQETGREIWAAITRWVPKLPGLIWAKMKGAFNSITSSLSSLAGDIWQKVKQLASRIARKLRETLPGLGGPDVDTGMDNPTRGSGSRGVGNPGPPPLDEDRGGVNITLAGGLDQLVERIERDTNFDF